MRNTLLTILLTILYVTTASGKPDSLYYELGARGYDLVLDMKYDEADEIFDELIRMEPKNAIGYLYKSQSFFHNWQYTYLNPDKKTLKNFKSLLFKAKEIASKMPEKDNVETQFLTGSAYGNIGLYYANTDRWLRAFWYGRKGIRYIRKIEEKNPEYSNIYFLLGMYNYYAATLPKVVKSLSFLLGGSEGDRNKGIEQLTLASKKGDLKDDAKIFLADSIYFEEKNYKAALALLEDLTDKYPDNHYLSLIQAISYHQLNKFDLSIHTLTSSLKSESLNKFPYLHGHMYYSLGMAYSRINEYDKAVPAYEKAYEIFKNMKGFVSDQFDAWSLYRIGDSYEMLGSFNKAHEYYSKIEESDREAFNSAQTRIKYPLTPARIKLIKGRNYLKYGKNSKAKEILKILINPESGTKLNTGTVKAEACLYLGQAEYHLKEYQSSIETLNKVFNFNNVKEEWISPWSHFWLARCYSKMGDNEKAEQEYDKAYEYNDDEIRTRIDEARSRE